MINHTPNGGTHSDLAYLSDVDRIRVLERAIELEVDKSDFSFRTTSEEHVWDELENEFLERCSKLGPVWIAA